MKKTFLTRRNALLTPGSFSWGSYALVIVVCLLVLRLLAPNFFWTVFAPVLRSADALSDRSHFFLSSFGDRATLALRNEQLESENTLLAVENQTLLQKLESLSATLGTPLPLQIVLDVVARPPESPYDTLLLAGGSKRGVTLGMEAIAISTGVSSASGGVPVGIVTSVSEDFSRATLFSSPGMRTTALVGKSSVPLTLSGAGAGTFSAVIARAAEVSVGDVVYGPGPGMLAIGRVSRIDSDPSLPSVVLRITPISNPFSLSSVMLRDNGVEFLKSFSIASTTFL